MVYFNPTTTTNKRPDAIFIRLHDTGSQPYPAWRYHEIRQPIMVRSTEEDKQMEAKGYKPINCPTFANPSLMNWHWDLIDMTPRQIVLFAMEEYNVELPETTREKLIEAIWKLHVSAPENKDRVVLMAHTAQMNYDETIKEIKRSADNDPADVTKEEFFA